MGTRSLTVIQDENLKEIVVMYRQFDGYPSGHGAELKELLGAKRLVNGFSPGESAAFNGMGCLAASVVAGFKREIGGFYLHAAGTRDCGEDYIYIIYPHDGAICLRVQSCFASDALYEGPITEFDPEKCESVS